MTRRRSSRRTSHTTAKAAKTRRAKAAAADKHVGAKIHRSTVNAPKAW